MQQYCVPHIEMISAPAAEVVSLDEVKTYIRVQHTADNSVIDLMVGAARQAAERYMRVSLITQSWRLSYHSRLPSILTLLKGPVQAISVVKSIAVDGTETLIDSGDYRLRNHRDEVMFVHVPSGDLVLLEYSAGFGDMAEDVPLAIRQGMLAHIAAMYDNRHTGVAMPRSSQQLYDGFKVVRL